MENKFNYQSYQCVKTVKQNDNLFFILLLANRELLFAVCETYSLVVRK